MEKTTLLVGKDIPSGSDFSAGCAVKGRTVITTLAPDEKNEPLSENGYTAVPWNRTSALSARSLLLHCLHTANRLDEAILYFDEGQCALDFNRTDATEIARTVDELILGYHYVVSEIVSRFEQKKLRGESVETGKLVFLYKTNPNQNDALSNANLRANATLSSPLVAAAAAAFKAFAENIAAVYAEASSLYPVLVICDASMEVAHRDSTLASWLCDYLDSIDDLKKRPSAKQLASWVKAGAKKAGGFGLF